MLFRDPECKKDIKIHKCIHRRATKQVKGLESMSFEERLKTMNLPTLKERRLKSDCIAPKK